MKKKDYPLSVLQDMHALFEDMQNMVEKWENVVQITKLSTTEITIEDQESHFYFAIANPSQGRDLATIVDLSYSPRNSKQVEKQYHTVGIPAVRKIFNDWITILIQ